MGYWIYDYPAEGRRWQRFHLTMTRSRWSASATWWSMLSASIRLMSMWRPVRHPREQVGERAHDDAAEQAMDSSCEQAPQREWSLRATAAKNAA